LPVKTKPAVPVPDRVTLCVLPAALLLLSVMVKEAARAPLAVGVNVTLTLQLPFDGSELPQVLVCPKSPGFAPVNQMLAMESVVFPVLLSVTLWAALVEVRVWLLKVRLGVESPAVGAVPVPIRVMLCGLPLALSGMLTEAVRTPGAVGVKVTLIVQVLEGVTVALVQVSALLVKSPGLAPIRVTLEMVKLAAPVLVRVLLCAELVVPTF
jgi:hypothetical protein